MHIYIHEHSLRRSHEGDFSSANMQSLTPFKCTRRTIKFQYVRSSYKITYNAEEIEGYPPNMYTICRSLSELILASRIAERFISLKI